MSKKKETKIKFLKKTRNKQIIIKALYIFLILCVILNIIFLINSMIRKIDYFNLMGISLFSMKTNSMREEIPKNSLIITKEYKNTENIKINDNIAYIVNGKIRINKIVSNEVIDGKIVYYTKSNNNYTMDGEGIYKNQIIGKVKKVVPLLGILFNILKSNITTILIIFFLVVKYIFNKKKYERIIKKWNIE